MLFENRFPEDLLVYIESVDVSSNEVLFDFIDSNEFAAFRTILGESPKVELPSMVLIRGYHGRKVQENTIYTIPKAAIQAISEANAITPYRKETNDPKINELGSYVIGYVMNVPPDIGEIFIKSVALTETEKWERNVFQSQLGDPSLIPSKIPVNTNAIVRDVGQGNWNEIWIADHLNLIFDCGAPSRSCISEVRVCVGNREEIIERDGPGIIISHWDLDHYHALASMSDDTLKRLSFFICRDHTPTFTSRIILGRIRSVLASDRIFCIPAELKQKGRVPLKLLSDITDNILLFNAHAHKDRNRSGILLVLRTPSKSVVFPADAHYYQISQYVLPHLNYRHLHSLVVPHHGGNAGEPEYQVKKQIPQNAIISVGANTYGHPMGRNINYLKTVKFKISQTRLRREDIQIAIR